MRCVLFFGLFVVVFCACADLISVSATNNQTTDQQALLAMKSLLASPSLLSGWTSSTLPCTNSWSDITCTGTRVQGIDWEDGICNSGTVKGRLATTIGMLDQVTLLHFGGCALSGTIPSQIGLLVLAQRFSLESNFFSGPLPSEMGLMTALTHLDMPSNRITGTIPTQLAALTNLAKDEWLANNNFFTGTVPSSLSSICSSLSSNADFQCNMLSGPASSSCLTATSGSCGSCPTGTTAASSSVAPGQCVYAIKPCARPLDTLATAYSPNCATPIASGSFCSPTCQPGYQPTGNLTIRCSGGNWSTPLGTCIPTVSTCTRPSDTASTIYSTATGCPNSSIANNGTCTPACAAGYYVNGSLTRTCTSGLLSASTGACVGNNCTLPADTASISFSTQCPSPIPSGTTCTPVCKAGSTNTGGSLAQTCTLGVLSNPVGTCTPNSCTRPADTASTIFSAACSNPINQGTSCTPTCATGYTANGTGITTITCTLGSLSAPASVCLQNPCARPADTSNTVFSTRCPATIAATATCTPTCAAGYSNTTGSLVQTCLLGQLTAAAGTCAPLSCPRPADTAATIYSAACAASIASGTTCVPTCNTGYTASASLSVTCTLGSLSSPAGTCTQNPCTRPADTATTIFSASPGCSNATILPGATCTPTCTAGYAASGGSLTQTCALGTLSTPAGTCALINTCLPSPCGNGTCTQTGPGTFSCTCNPGYLLPTCVTTQNNCLPNPCTNGGNCTNTGATTFSCQCSVYYSGATCSTAVNLCATNNGGCDNLTLCTNNINAPPSCGGCPVGFSGTGATRCVPIPPAITAVTPLGAVPGVTVLYLTGTNLGASAAAITVFVVAAGGTAWPCAVQVGSFTGTSLSCVLSAATPLGVYYINVTTVMTSPVSAVLNGSSAAAGMAVTVLAPPAVTSVAPPTGQSGAAVVVLGSGFGTVAAQVQVTFGGVPCPLAGNVSDGALTCVAPPLPIGPAAVVVTRLSISSSSAASFVYLPAVVPTVYSVSPTGVSAGTVLSIQGAQFGTNQSNIVVAIANATVAFRCAVVPGSLRSDGSFFTCALAPAVAAAVPGTLFSVNVTVGTTLATGLFYVSTVVPPTLLAVVPAGGVGGSFVTITGTNFAGAANTFITIGGSAAPIYQVLTGTSVVVIAPPLTPGPAAVQACVFSSSICSPAPLLSFLFISPVTISSVSPPGGVDGTILLLTGSQLGLDSDMAVTVGGVPCSLVAGSITATTFRCIFNGTTLTPGASYVVAVTRFATAAVGPILFFNFIIPPAIATVAPLGGLPSSTLSLTGSNFGYLETDLAITLGGTACGVIYGSLNGAGTAVSCILPAAIAVGVYPVALSRLGVPGTNNGAIFFAVIAAPAVTALSPAGGSQASSQPTTLTVTGSNFGVVAAAVAVAVGPFPCVVVPPSLTDSSLVCIVTNTGGVIGPENVVVTVFTTSSTPTSSAVFSFINAPVVTVVSPGGSVAGHSVTITGFNFGAVVADLAVTIMLPSSSSFPSAPVPTPCPIAPASLDILGSVFTCTLPPLLAPLSPTNLTANVFPFTLTRYSVSAGASGTALAVQYIIPPTITSITPAGALTQGGVSITIGGTGFSTAAANLQVLINGNTLCSLDTTFPVTDTAVACVLPGLIAGTYPVTLLRFDVPSSNSFPFSYFDPPVITAVAPAGGIAGTRITITGANFGGNEAALQVALGERQEVPCAVVAGSLLTTSSQSSLTCILAPLPNTTTGGPTPVAIVAYWHVFTGVATFDVVDPLPNITSINPASGVVGTQVDIVGEAFGVYEAALTVLVGTAGDVCLVVTGSLNVAGTLFSCRMPSAARFNGAGAVPVTITREGFGLVPAPPVVFTFITSGSPPIVFTTTPAGGLATGTLLTISGANFADTIPVSTVAVGADDCPVVAITTSVIVCNTSISSGIAAGTFLPIVVTSYGMTDSIPHASFVVGVAFPPHIAAITPVGGEAGTLVTLTGNGFASESSTTINMGYFACPIVPGSLTYPSSTSSSSTQTVVCVAPANFPGENAVFLTSMGVAATAPLPSFLYPAEPEITAVSPAGGIPGTTTVDVMARNIPTSAAFAAGITIVWTSLSNNCSASCQPAIAGTDSVGVTTLTCLLPPIACADPAFDPASFLERVQVVVAVFGAISYPAAGGFVYAYAFPIVTAIAPEGQVAGQVVTVRGSFFGLPGDATTVAVEVGGLPCQLVPNTLTAAVDTLACIVSPALPSTPTAIFSLVTYGSLPAIIDITPDNNNNNNNNNNTNVALPVVSVQAVVVGVTPAIGRAGDIVTLTGTGFNAAAAAAEVHTSATAVLANNVSEAVVCPIITATATSIICRLAVASSSSSSPSHILANGGDIGFSVVSFHIDVYGVVGASSTATLVFYKTAFFLPMSSPVVIIFFIISALFAAAIFVTMYVYFVNRKEKSYRPQSPLFCEVICVGLLIVLCAIFTFASRPTVPLCQARIWLLALGYTLTFGVLFVKSWRINLIFNNKGMRRMIITDTNLAAKVAAMLVVDVVLLIAFTVQMPAPDLAVNVAGEQVYWTCHLYQQEYPIHLLILVLYKGCTILYGIYLSYSNRNVASAFNESKHMAFCIYIFAALIVLVIPIATLLESNPTAFFAIVAAACIIVVSSFWVSLFGSRLYAVFFLHDRDDWDAFKMTADIGNAGASSVKDGGSPTRSAENSPHTTLDDAQSGGGGGVMRASNSGTRLNEMAALSSRNNLGFDWE